MSNNNNKQKVYSVLDGLTQTELNNYIKDRNIKIEHDELIEKFEKLKAIKKPSDHYSCHAQNINDDLFQTLNSYCNLGMAWVIAIVFECFNDNEYKIEDIKKNLRVLIENDKQLKEMVYDCMKDF